jgi:integrase/recombinase XerD
MNWKAQLIKRDGKSRIAIYFEKNYDWIERIKELEGSRWCQTLGVWHLPDTFENRMLFQVDETPIKLPSPEGIAQIEKFKHWLSSRRYSNSTIRTYTEALKSFLTFFNEKPVSEITNQDIVLFNYEYILNNKLSESYQNQIVNAIKLFFLTIQDTKIEVEKIHRPKRAKILPNVLRLWIALWRIISPAASPYRFHAEYRNTKKCQREKRPDNAFISKNFRNASRILYYF